jgi:hypothetical protein
MLIKNSLEKLFDCAMLQLIKKTKLRHINWSKPIKMKIEDTLTEIFKNNKKTINCGNY